MMSIDIHINGPFDDTEMRNRMFRYLGLRYTPEELRRIRNHYEQQKRDLGLTDSHDEWRELNNA